MSLHLLGAESGKAVLVRVKNPLDLAAAKGGPKGAIASWAIPKTTTEMVLKQMADQFNKSLADSGVAADVLVIDDVGSLPVKGNKDLLTGVVVGVGLVGGLFAAWKFGIKRFFTKG